MKIIKATTNEVAAIVSLNLYVQKIHHAEYPDIFKPAFNDDSIRSFFEFLIKQESNTILLAYIDSTPVGYAWYAIVKKLGHPMKYSRKQISIHQISVHEKFRRQKVGHSLFGEIERQAQDQGITHFELDSWAFNTGAHSFFNKLGFETYSINMWRRS